MSYSQIWVIFQQCPRPETGTKSLCLTIFIIGQSQANLLVLELHLLLTYIEPPLPFWHESGLIMVNVVFDILMNSF